MTLGRAILVIAAVSCAVPPVDYTGKTCPAGVCPPGYGCVEGRCYREGEEPARPDAGVPDGGPADAGLAPLAAPASLDAVVGPRSGVVTLEWPEVVPPASGAERIAGYRILWGPREGDYPQERSVPRAVGCAAEACRADVEGQRDNVRVYAQVRSIDGLGNESVRADSPTTSATPINGAWTNATDWTVFSECFARPSFDGGLLTFDQSTPDGGCVTLALGGDSLWRDFTLDVELNPGPGTYEAGVGIRASPSQYLAVTAAHWQSDRAATVGIARVAGLASPSGAAAASVARLDPGFWHALRIVASGPTLSISLGSSAASLTEVLRWSDPTGAVPGAFAFGLFTTQESGRAAFRYPRVSTRATLPPSGPRRVFFDFAAGIPQAMRVMAGGSAAVGAVPCPAYPGAQGCDAGECPAPSASCLKVDNSAATAPESAAAGFDLPVGIDPAADFRVRFKFAAEAAATDPKVLFSQQGAMIYSAGADWSQNLQALERNLGRALTPRQWHAFELRLQPSAGQFALTWNGQTATYSPYPPSNWSAHPGPFWLGAASGGAPGRVHAYFTDVEAVQP